ncbi:hypothetical protein BH688_05620 [Kushneria phosphatilytica]|nr:hypothetical protein BH688_05620 [Kushneria phosphatilytica]
MIEAYSVAVTYIAVGLALSNLGKDLRGRSESWGGRDWGYMGKWALAWPYGLGRLAAYKLAP